MKFTGERFIPGETEKELEIEHVQRYELLKEYVAGQRVLDAACGEGYGSYLLSQTAQSVTGIDISAASIANANMKYNGDNLNFIEASIDNMPLIDASFDIVISFETLEHVDEKTQLQFMSEVKRVLVRDGSLVISTPNKKFYSEIPSYTNPFHVKELYKEEFVELLQTYYKNIKVASQRFEVSSIIDTRETDSSLYKRTNESSDDYIHEKYMIAFCSDVAERAFPVASISIFPKKYDEIIVRLSVLQEEVYERNQHISTLNQEIDFLRGVFQDYEIIRLKLEKGELITLESHQNALEISLSENEKIKLENKKIKCELEKLAEKLEISEGINAELETNLLQLNDRLESASIDLNNKIGHINQLLQKERDLQNIYISTGWKMLSNYYKFRDRIIPPDSKRKVISKLASETMKKPKLMFSKLNKNNLKKLKYYIQTEDGSRLESRIDSYVERHIESGPQEIQVQLYSDQEYNKLAFEKQTDPLVSIIIPVYNQWEFTYSCLASILHNTPDIAYEIIIADDMSTDETTNIMEYIENITVVRDGVNRGFLLNCNNAAKIAQGKYIFFLNNDTNVQTDWLGSLIELAESDESIGMVGSKLVFPDGKLQEAGGIIWNDASGWNYGRLDDPDKPEYNYVKEVDYVSGAAILVKSSIWQQLNGFDERYVPAYFEDSDLAFEIRRLGYKVLLQPKSVIVHFEGISHGTDTNSGIKSYQMKNKEKFLEKWNLDLTNDHFSNAEHVFWARDRSGKRKTIVVVDHYVPHYDKDAGGRCTYFYMKLFISMGFHVIFIGDNFYKHEPYTSELQQLGIEVLYGDYYAKNINKWIKSNAAYIDYVYLNRPHISVKYIETFKKFTFAKIIYFGHDLHYLREMRNYELTQNQSLLKSSDDWKKIEFGLFTAADVIHVVGSYEQALLQGEFPGKPVRNIPLFPYEYSYGNTVLVPEFDERKDLLFVGGFNHTPNYDGVVWFIEEIFPSIKQHIPGIKLYIVGSNPPDDLKASAADDIIVTGFVSDEELENFYNRTRLVVVPLRYGAGVKGKVVEALYYQVPVVTTAIGAEGLEMAESIMSINDKPDDFAMSVVSLYQDQDQWFKYFQSSAGYIRQYFSVEAAEKVIAYDISNQETIK